MVTAKPYGKCSRGTSPVYLVYLVQPNKRDKPNKPKNGLLLVPHPSGKLRKELPREVAGIGWVDVILAAKIVV